MVACRVLGATLGHLRADGAMAVAAAGTALQSQEPKHSPAGMSQRDKFLLDMHGYLVVEEFLTKEEVRALNQSFDANWGKRELGLNSVKRRGTDQFHGMLGWPLPHSQPFRALLAHPKLVPFLSEILGPGFRADQSPFLLTSATGYSGPPGGGMAVHGGGQPGEHGAWGTKEKALGGAYYRYANDVMRSGMLVCSFQLTDIDAGDGGFGVIPGSHKCNFAVPDDVVFSPTRDFGTERAGKKGDGIHPPVVNPACPVGSMAIFLEATYHTTLPWTNQHHERRSLLYRYSSRTMAYHSGLHSATQPAWVQQLSQEQQAVLEPPWIGHPELGNDGFLRRPLEETRVTGLPHEATGHAVAEEAQRPQASPEPKKPQR